MKQNQRAALYLRSSKDRSDVSIDAQRRELQKLAADRDFLIVQEYTDVVESGKDTYRPGFQMMLRDLKATRRQWGILLMVDTSRLSRRRYAAQAFKHEAKKRGIDILYSKVPEVDPITNVLIESVLEAFDEVHSLMSREKGLGGMAENVQKGFRAGGRAPRGYRLRHIPTGTIRDGEEVTKSVLELSDDAPLVARYLKARALGRTRRALKTELGIIWPASGLVGMEWNAITYAGHTAWNVHNEFDRGEGYKNGQKRRPREEWHIKRDTHTAIITEEEATAIVAQLEASPHNRKRRTDATYLLSGILKSPDGVPWYGNGENGYRNKAHQKNVCRDAVETAVVNQVIDDMKSAKFAEQLYDQARNYSTTKRDDPTAQMRKQLKDVLGKISKMMDIAAGLEEPGPALRKIDELERSRKSLAEEIERLETEHKVAEELQGVTLDRVQKILVDSVHEMQLMNRESMKDMLSNLIERIELHPSTFECQIHYRIGIGNNVASPRGCPAIPALRLIRRLLIAA
jgi:site-specific DNA recombinase